MQPENIEYISLIGIILWVLIDFGFLIVDLKCAFSPTGVVLAVTIMNIINECCRSNQCKLRTPYILKLGAGILPLVFMWSS